MLRIRNIHKTYRLGRVSVPVLRGVDLDVAEGEWVSLLGASGSGKSTLLHLVAALDAPDKSPAGTIEFEGRSVHRAPQGARNGYRRERIGLVFQFYHLLPELSVLENTMLASMIGKGRLTYSREARAIRERASGLLTAAGLGERLRHRPAELSGGERQRVAIARSLMNRPRLLLADEPTGNLDRATGVQILDLLTQVRAEQGLSVLVVTHDDETAARGDRTVRMTDGRISEEPANGG